MEYFLKIKINTKNPGEQNQFKIKTRSVNSAIQSHLKPKAKGKSIDTNPI